MRRKSSFSVAFFLAFVWPFFSLAQSDTSATEIDSVPACPPFFAIELDKMNAVYIGFDNPIRIAAEGVPPAQLRVEGRGVHVRAAGCGRYVVTAWKPGRGALRITAPGWTDTLEAPLRIKRIPTVEARLGARYCGGHISSGTFRAQGGIAAVVLNTDFDVKCDIVGFDVSWRRADRDVGQLQNEGARWNPAVNDLIQRARTGDVYFFDNIRVRCPGDDCGQNVKTLVFWIK